MQDKVDRWWVRQGLICLSQLPPKLSGYNRKTQTNRFCHLATQRYAHLPRLTTLLLPITTLTSHQHPPNLQHYKANHLLENIILTEESWQKACNTRARARTHVGLHTHTPTPISTQTVYIYLRTVYIYINIYIIANLRLRQTVSSREAYT